MAIPTLLSSHQQKSTTSHPKPKTSNPDIPLEQDVSLIEPDAHLIAKAIISQRSKKLKGAPTSVDLAKSITQIQVNGLMKGIQNIVVSIVDDDFTLLDSGIFDTDETGLLDPIEINYPSPSKHWWRLMQVEPHGDGSTDLTFVIRGAVWLMMLKGPVKVDRAKKTRAEFLKMLCDKVKEGRIAFHSIQLDVKQKIDPISGAGGGGGSGQASVAKPIPSASKASGMAWRLNTSYENDPPGHTSAFGHLPADQRGWSELSSWGTLDFSSLGFRVPGGTIANIRNPANGRTTSAPLVDIGQGGGNNHPVIGLYAQTLRELGLPLSDAVVDFQLANGQQIHPVAGVPAGAVAGGAAGGGSTTTTIIEPYYFEVQPNETYWDAMNRLAQEVNWELFFEGDTLYYDSELTLIHQKVAEEWKRDERYVFDWDFTYDARAIASQGTVNIACEVFAVHPGEVVKVTNFGPASTGTTAKMPGCWLVDSLQRNKGDIFTQYTLKQPEKPKNEPAPQTKTVTVPGAGGSTANLVGGATNPAPGATWSRLDMGFDGNYSSAGLVAPYSGTVHNPHIDGWPGQGTYFYIVNDNQSGPDYTRAMYFAEGASMAVPDGAHVAAGQRIGNPVASGGNGSPGNFEIGPAQVNGGDCLAKQYGLGSSGAAGMVKAFASWLQSLGAGAPTSTGNAGAA